MSRPNLTPEDRLAIGRAMKWVASADGINAKERQVIDFVCEQLEVSPAELDELVPANVGKTPLSAGAGEALVCILSRVVTADRVVTQEERRRLDLLADKLRLDRKALERAILDRLSGAPR